MENIQSIQHDTKKDFMKKGSCSQAYCFFLNREFGSLKGMEERAADPLAGGIIMQGHQCGMLWGSSLAVGAECFRRYSDRGTAIAAAVTATGKVMESYAGRTGSVNCRDVCGHDFTKKTDLFKFMLKFILHINRDCLELADKWLPEATRAAAAGLSAAPVYSREPVSCAAEVAKRMGASDEETVMVSGLAGGMGLSGNGCGAVAAAIWMRSLAWLRENPGKSAFNNPYAKHVLKVFFRANGPEMVCSKITGRRFASMDEHTEFIKSGGCAKIIETLAGA